MTDAERKAASRARKRLADAAPNRDPVDYAGPRPKLKASRPQPGTVSNPLTVVVRPAPPSSPVTPPVAKAGKPPPIGDALAEHELLTATLKARASKPDASGQDVANYQRGLERLTELRAGSVPELTESSMARSPIFFRWVKRLLDAVENVPGALEAMRAELAK
jgi:hypothetical protein